MKKHILMIYPEFPTTYWSLKHALAFVGKKTAMSPLGLLTVAALLPADYSIKLVDLNVESLDPADIDEADLVFISAMIIQKPSFDEVVALCNRKGVPVVAGGPYPTSSYAKISGVDYFVLNEAEMTLPLFISDYESGNLKKIYITGEKPDITKTPPPRFDLIDFKHYNNIALQNSRGCPFNCEFCDIVELFGRVPRFKESAQFVNEVDIVYRQGFRGSVFIVDDNFIGNKPKVKDLLRAIIDWQKNHGNPFKFFTEASINLADDDELLQLMVNAGFDMVFVGIETPAIESLESCDKSQNLGRSLYASIEKIQKAGIVVTGGFIVGFDNDRDDIFDRQIDFIQTAGIPMAMIGILGALPGTRLYNRLSEEGRLSGSNDFSGDNTHNLKMSFTPVMDEYKIVEGYKKIISEIYSPKKYFERCYTMIKKLPPSDARFSGRLSLAEIKAFFRSLFLQGFSRYSFIYFKFIVKVLMHKPSRFPMAVEHAVKGHHFFIITNDILKAGELSLQLDSAKIMMKEIFENYPGQPEISGVLVKQIKAHVHRRNAIEKEYARISNDAKRHLNEQFDEYVRMFDSYIPEIKVKHPQQSVSDMS